MLKTPAIIVFFVILFTSSCDLFESKQNITDITPDTTGIVVFDFNLPTFRITDKLAAQYPNEDINRDVFRYHLNIYPVDMAGSVTGDYIRCAGLSRAKQFYTFLLKPGLYHYEGAIICTGLEILCDTVGFPEDNLLWTYGQFEVIKDSTLSIGLSFSVAALQ